MYLCKETGLSAHMGLFMFSEGRLAPLLLSDVYGVVCDICVSECACFRKAV